METTNLKSEAVRKSYFWFGSLHWTFVPLSPLPRSRVLWRSIALEAWECTFLLSMVLLEGFLRGEGPPTVRSGTPLSSVFSRTPELKCSWKPWRTDLGSYLSLRCFQLPVWLWSSTGRGDPRTWLLCSVTLQKVSSPCFLNHPWLGSPGTDTRTSLPSLLAPLCSTLLPSLHLNSPCYITLYFCQINMEWKIIYMRKRDRKDKERITSQYCNDFHLRIFKLKIRLKV